MSLPPDVSVVRLDNKCRVVIPKLVRETAGLSPGSLLVVAAAGEVVLLHKAELVLKEVW